jgi:hypothetical protein
VVEGAPGLSLNDCEPVKDEPVALRRAELPIHPEVEQGESAVLMKDDVPRVKIGMEEPVGNEHLEHDVDYQPHQALFGRCVERVLRLMQAHAFDPVHGQDTMGGMTPVYSRKLDISSS